MRTKRLSIAASLALAAAVAVAVTTWAESEESKPTPRVEPTHVTVQHVLIGFKRSVRGKKLARTKEQARALAQRLLDRARDGEDFSTMVEQYTDDSGPGIYKLTNRDEPLMGGAQKRDDMAPGFGDVAFALEVGEIGIVEFNYRNSPYGWHIVKRLE